MKSKKLTKAIVLAFALGAILSVASDPNITHQVQTIALSKASATAINAMRSLGHWLKRGQDAALKGLVMPQ